MTPDLPTKCPHSSARDARPSTCSLCVAAATGVRPKMVTFDEETHQLRLDGVIVARGSDAETARITPPNASKRRGGGRRARECSVCGSTDHVKPRCDGSGRNQPMNAEGDKL